MRSQGAKEKDRLTSNSLTLGAPQTAMLKSLWLGNLVVFALLAGGAFLLAPPFTALGVLVGGLVALANFRILQRTIIKSLMPKDKTKSGTMGLVLLKYYLRFAATAVLLWILVRQGYVDPLGLLAGLSVVVVSIIVFGALQARKLIREGC